MHATVLICPLKTLTACSECIPTYSWVLQTSKMSPTSFLFFVKLRTCLCYKSKNRLSFMKLQTVYPSYTESYWSLSFQQLHSLFLHKPYLILPKRWLWYPGFHYREWGRGGNQTGDWPILPFPSRIRECHSSKTLGIQDLSLQIKKLMPRRFPCIELAWWAFMADMVLHCGRYKCKQETDLVLFIQKSDNS